MERIAAFCCDGSMCRTMIVSLRWPVVPSSPLPVASAMSAGGVLPAVGADQQDVHDVAGVVVAARPGMSSRVSWLQLVAEIEVAGADQQHAEREEDDESGAQPATPGALAKSGARHSGRVSHGSSVAGAAGSTVAAGHRSPISAARYDRIRGDGRTRGRSGRRGGPGHRRVAGPHPRPVGGRRATGARWCGQFGRAVLRRVPPAQLAAADPAALAAAVADSFVFVDTRAPGAVRVRVYDPEVALDGGRPAGSVVEVSCEDRQFIVSSVTEELRRLGHRVVRELHPVFGCERDAGGRVVRHAPGPPGGPAGVVPAGGAG